MTVPTVGYIRNDCLRSVLRVCIYMHACVRVIGATHDLYVCVHEIQVFAASSVTLCYIVQLASFFVSSWFYHLIGFFLVELCCPNHGVMAP